MSNDKQIMIDLIIVNSPDQLLQNTFETTETIPTNIRMPRSYGEDQIIVLR